MAHKKDGEKKDIIKLSPGGVKYVDPDELIRTPTLIRQVQELKKMRPLIRSRQKENN